MDAGTGLLEQDSLRQAIDPTARRDREFSNSCFDNSANFLRTLAGATYQDARDLYVNRAGEKPSRTLSLLRDSRVRDDVLLKAIDILAPTDENSSAASPALYYLLCDLRDIRAKSETSSEPITVKTPRATHTKQMEWAEASYTPPSGLDLTRSVDNAIGGIYSVIHSVAPKYDLQKGDLPGLLAAHNALVRGAR